MAEIHVQTKKHNSSGSMWIWIVLAVVIAGAVIWYLTTRNKEGNNISPANNTTGRVIQDDNNPLRIEHILESTVTYFC